jgi:large subunit ribosomal protein L3
MTQVFDEAGRLVPVTVLRVRPNLVVARRTEERDGYSAVVLGALEQKPSRLAKPVLGQYKEGMTPRRLLTEVRNFGQEVEVGVELGISLFEEIRFVDVSGVTKGKGFQGVMKRHGFHGGRKTHGSKFHRVNGSTGNATTPAHVLPGRPMAGRMGGDKFTVLNLRVVKIDLENGLMLVQGAVPGASNGTVRIRPAVKKAMN